MASPAPESHMTTVESPTPSTSNPPITNSEAGATPRPEQQEINTGAPEGPPSIWLLVALGMALISNIVVMAFLHFRSQQAAERMRQQLKALQSLVDQRTQDTNWKLGLLQKELSSTRHSLPATVASVNAYEPSAKSPAMERDLHDFLEGIRRAFMDPSRSGSRNMGNDIIDLLIDAQGLPNSPVAFIQALEEIKRSVVPTAIQQVALTLHDPLSYRELGEHIMDRLLTDKSQKTKAPIVSQDEIQEAWRQSLIDLGYELDRLIDEKLITPSLLMNIEKRLALLLEELGVETLKPEIGTAVNLTQHEIINTLRSPKVPANTIESVIRRGYSSGSHIISKAKVVMGVQ